MEPPQRIVSLISSATEILYLLGLGTRVVGVSHECDYPAEVLTRPRLTRSLVDSLEILAHLLHPECFSPPPGVPQPAWRRLSTRGDQLVAEPS